MESSIARLVEMFEERFGRRITTWVVAVLVSAAMVLAVRIILFDCVTPLAQEIPLVWGYMHGVDVGPLFRNGMWLPRVFSILAPVAILIWARWMIGSMLSSRRLTLRTVELAQEYLKEAESYRSESNLILRESRRRMDDPKRNVTEGVSPPLAANRDIYPKDPPAPAP